MHRRCGRQLTTMTLWGPSHCYTPANFLAINQKKMGHPYHLLPCACQWEFILSYENKQQEQALAEHNTKKTLITRFLIVSIIHCITQAMAQVRVFQLFHDASTPQAFFFFLWLCFTLALILLLHFATTRPRANQEPLPPSPPKLPVIGHLHYLMARSDSPHVSLRDLAEKHGADGLMLLRLGQVANLIASSPRAAEAILHAHDHAFASRPRSAVADILVSGASDVGFAPYGEYWRKARRLVTTHLLSAGKVQSFRRAREEEARLVISKIHQEVATRGAGAVVDMTEVLNSFESDLVCRAVSGKFFREEGRNKLFRELIDGNVALFGGFNLEDYFPSLAKVDLLTRVVCKKAMKHKKRWDELLDELIDEHASKTSQHLHGREEDANWNQEEEEDRDFIDVLLSLQHEYSLTREHMKAILMDMFSAGTDTSYIVLEFAMAELIRKPHLLTKLQAEVRTNTPKGKEMVEEAYLPSMAYLKAVIKETLRLHPPVPLLLPHFSMAECNVDGYRIPKGTRVLVNAWAIGRDGRCWEKADEFVPERFTDGGGAAAVDFKGRDFQLLPFGAGRRICPGMNFGMASVEIMLANLVYCFDWELPPGMKKQDVDMTDVFGATVRRKEKLLLVPRPHDVNHI